MAGFTEWLKSKGVVQISEDSRVVKKEEGGKLYDAKLNHNRQAIYKFKNEKAANDFMEEFGLNKAECGIEKAGKVLRVRITKDMQKKLKAGYLEHNPAVESKEYLEEKLAAVKKAKAELLEFNKFANPSSLTERYNEKGFDKVGMMAKLLRNKEEKGWYRHIAKPAGAMALSVYYALNYDTLSEASRSLATNAMKEISSFNVSLNPEYKKAFDNKERDILIIHAGGMLGHSAYRLIKREKDSKGVERYYYTKADGGAGLEQLNAEVYGIYTTEIKPVYKRNFFGSYVELSEEEKINANANPKLYQKYMQDTLDHLISCEIAIEEYTAPKISNRNGEPQSKKDAKEWNRLNDIILKARGEIVLGRSQATSQQLSGNCTVYSFMLLIGALIGVNLAYDMMQEVKGYNHHNVLWRLNEIEQDIENKLIVHEIKDKILKNEKIKDQDPLAYAIRNEIKIDGKDALEWAQEYNENKSANERLTINGQAPEVWAEAHYNKSLMKKIIKNELIEGKDPLKYALEKNIQLYNMHPLIWALEHNRHSDKKVQIDGQDPLIWGIKNNSSIKIEGISFVRYLQVYGIESFSKLASLDERKEIMSALIQEYDRLKNDPYVKKSEIADLEGFYNALYARVNFADREEMIRNRKTHVTQLGDILSKYTSTELAAIIKENNTLEQRSNIVPEDIIEKLPLKEAHKLWKVGNKIADTGVVQTVIDAITIAIIKIGDVFRVESKEESIKKSTNFQDLIKQNREQSNTEQSR